VDYQYALDLFRDRVLGDGLGTVLQVAATILTTGHAITPPKGPAVTLKGPAQAMAFVADSMDTLAARFRTAAVEGNVMSDAGSIYQRYLARKAAPTVGVETGFEKIDHAHGGMKPGDLALVLGFTGQLKSMIVLNIAYRAAVFHGKHVAIVPLEQSAQATMDSLAVLHCQHPKFGDSFLALTYDRLRAGTLTPSEEDLLQTAMGDLQTCKDYGCCLYKEPDKAEVTVGDIRRWAEAKARAVPLDLLVVDYLGLVNPSSGGLSMRESAIANLAIREAKQLAMTFNHGKGLSVLSPFQANRDGFKEAEKNGGRYNLRALAWASEAEKSADLVYSVYRDEPMARSHRAQLGNLKARDRPLILDTWSVYANPALRAVRDEDYLAPGQQPIAV
jgi:replicative DNA helicase